MNSVGLPPSARGGDDVPRLAVIPAAGAGRRLLPLSRQLPKCLVAVCGETLLRRALRQLVLVGVHRAVLVTGHKASMVVEEVKAAACKPDVIDVHNPDYANTGSLASLARTTDWWEEPLIILDADLVFQDALLMRLAAQRGDRLVVSVGSPLAELDMRVRVQDDRVHELGKDLPALGTTGEFIGMSKWTRAGAETLAHALQGAVAAGKQDDWYETAIGYVARDRCVGVLTTTGAEWAEVDTLEDLRRVQARFRSRGLAAAARTTSGEAVPASWPVCGLLEGRGYAGR